MAEQILPDIYKIEIPLPQNPLKATNSYFIRGPQRNLLVDTGFNCDESRNAMDQALQELDINMEKTDLFITHLHSDHGGLAGYLATPQTTIWMSENDGRIIADSRDSQHWVMFNNFARFSGLVATGVEGGVEKHPGFRFASKPFDQFTMVKDGDEIRVGDYCFRCVLTKGHTAGHICLYDQQKKLLLSGDHILGKITPNITLWKMGDDVLGDYLASLDKIAALEIDLVLPGHRHLITDCRGRVEELKQHHHRRLNEVLGLIRQERMCAAEVASLMVWDLSYKNWEDFPWGQKLFATGEAMSHLYHLMEKGAIKSTVINEVVYFEAI